MDQAAFSCVSFPTGCDRTRCCRGRGVMMDTRSRRQAWREKDHRFDEICVTCDEVLIPRSRSGRLIMSLRCAAGASDQVKVQPPGVLPGALRLQVSPHEGQMLEGVHQSSCLSGCSRHPHDWSVSARTAVVVGRTPETLRTGQSSVGTSGITFRAPLLRQKRGFALISVTALRDP